ncbi:MAG TPA: phage protein Gp37 [Phycisphaerae bacterium]|nr:phage protein Gp37 [Phycisphaerae bacterium]
MSRLGNLEDALVARLRAAQAGGSPAFATVRGISGGYRPAIREGLQRERMPAAFVAFTDEPTAPETKLSLRGARFVVLVAARVLRVEGDPRHGDPPPADSAGAFALLDAARAQLDDYEPGDGTRAVNLQVKFVDADDRTAIYELLYRLWPIEKAALTFGGTKIADGAVMLSLEVGPLAVKHAIVPAADAGGGVRQVSWVRGRTIVWRGQLRAADAAELDAIEAEIRKLVLSRAEGDFADDAGRVFEGCVLDKLALDGTRQTAVGGFAVQDVELHFLQRVPTDESGAAGP